MPRTQRQPTDRLQTNIFGMLVALVIFGLAAVYLTMAFSTQDALWFVTGFNEVPDRIVIYNAGQRIELLPGRQQYDRMAEAVRASLAQGIQRTSGVGLSQSSLDDAYNQYLTVEVFFNQPVKLHGGQNTGYPDQMLFPITGRHSDQPIVFLGRNGTYMADGPILKTVEPIREELRSEGYLQ